MPTLHPGRILILVWLAWAIILLSFQSLATARFQPQRPDLALDWLKTETLANSQQGKTYLVDPFMNNQVAWDSEFYLSIATVGYDDPAVRAIPPDFTWLRPRFCTAGQDSPCYSLNYAFMPGYPYLTRWVALPLRILPLTPIAASILAAVIVSVLGTLAALLALYDLTKDELGQAGGMRTAFYLLIFPSSFFLAQVYTEGLFVGAAFGCLALVRRKKWLAAGILAVLAVWTRAVGVALFIPLAIAWLGEFDAQHIDRETLVRTLVAAAPLAAYGAWHFSDWGQAFAVVEHVYFSREPFVIQRSLEAWTVAWNSFLSNNLQARIYYAIEFGATLLGVAACLWTMRDHPGMALFGLAVIALSLTSGVAQGMHRYVLAVPSIFLALGRLGKSEAFDRSWSLLSTLLMGMYATLFAFDLWAG